MAFQRQEGSFSGYDDLELFWQSWLVSNPRATLIITHGHGEHSECYSNLVEGLTGSGYQVYGWDLRGHGKSGGKRGVVSSFDEYIRDLRLFIEYVRPRIQSHPFYLLGHSMGALVLLKYLTRNGLGWSSGIVLSSPLLGIKVKVTKTKARLAKMLGSIAPGITLPTEIKNEDLTRDKVLLRKYEKDPYRHDRMNSVLYMAIIDNIEYILQRADKIPGPVLMQISGKDKVVSHEAAISFYENLPIKEKQLIVYENMTHEVYNDVQRAKPHGDLKRWLDLQIEKLNQKAGEKT